jgi:signal transduction histidine kinase
LSYSANSACITIKDDGRNPFNFDPTSLVNLQQSKHFGIISMKNWVKAAKGKLAFDSGLDGNRVTMLLPLS